MQLTARQAYIDILTELVKEEAPTCILRITFIILIKRSVSIWKLGMRCWNKPAAGRWYEVLEEVLPGILLETPSAVYTKVYQAQQWR
jgi:hypothetical protein